MKDQNLIDAYNKKREAEGLPPVSLTFTHVYPFTGKKRPDYNP